MGNTKYLVCLFSITKIYFVILSLFSPFLLKGQEVFRFQKLSVEQNLSSQTYNWYVFTDSEGFVWISSINGLNRFDGKEVVQYHPHLKDTLSLAGSNIQSRFFEDKNKNLWFTSSEAIHKYNRKNNHFHRYYIKENKLRIHGTYQLLYLDTLNGSPWVRIDDKLFIYPANNSIDTSTFLFNIPNSAFCQIENSSGSIDFDKFLFATSSSGLHVRGLKEDKKVWRSDTLNTYLRGHDVNTLYFENDEQVWVGADTGLIELNLVNSHERLFRDFNGSSITDIKGIVPFGNDMLIIATIENGVYYFDKKNRRFTKQFFSIEEERIQPFKHVIDRIYLDQDNTLWISCGGRGLYYVNLDKKKFSTFLQNPFGEPSKLNNVKSLTEDLDGRIWGLTWGGIVVTDSLGQTVDLYQKHLEQEHVFVDNQPSYIYADQKGRIWACTREALYVLKRNAERFEKILFKPEITAPWFTFMWEFNDQDYKLLVSTVRHGMLEIKEETDGFSILPVPGLAGKYTLIHETKEGQVLICEDEAGINIFHEENNKLSLDTTILHNAQINGILDDITGGKTWVATADGLFNLYKQDETYFYQKDTIFNFRTLNGILQDNNGYLWISTNRGLIKYHPERAEIRDYRLADGLQSLEFNFWSALKTKSGKLAFGGVNGANFFNPNEIKDIEIQARPTITEIKINGELPTYQLKCDSTKALNISEIRKLVFKSRENSLSVKVTALEYSDPSSNQFRYRLKGKGDTWVHNGTDNTINLSFLSPGYYNLEVDATNSDGQWSNHPHRLQIRIKPPWYLSIPAIIFYILTTIGFIYAYYRYRIGQIRMEEEFKRKEAEFKQKEAEYKQLVAETETAVLRLQMNPHFIFNSMNSINSYILQKDVDTASDYLNRFAKLMRMILKFAVKPLIAISDEIELLELYLQTETMRFDKKFNYSFDLKDDLDPDEFVIPTMILQPFVENAIWHGLSNKKGGEGHIKISFWQKNESFLCSVEDNGVGRAASNQNAKKHESKALSITAHRLQLLGKKNGVEASFEIQDLTDADQNPTGTKVVLKFPLL